MTHFTFWMVLPQSLYATNSWKNNRLDFVSDYVFLEFYINRETRITTKEHMLHTTYGTSKK